jgi:aminoglycoside 6'-N-acetyltransferase I
VSAGWSIRQARLEDSAAWRQLRTALWLDGLLADDTAEIERIVAHPHDMVAFLGLDAHGAAIGFAEATLRRDHVNGTDTSPVGFLEGLYVIPSMRRLGVGRALVAAVEQWTRERRCTELASDALLDNTASHAAHVAYGFEETERVVYFRKPLTP